MEQRMTRRQKITVSIVGISLVLLTLLGITYAYYLTRIQGNTNEDSISIKTAKLELNYKDGNGNLEFNRIMPGDELASKTFSVENKGNTSINEYAVSLEEVVNTLERNEDVTYALTCVQKNSSGVITGECNGTNGEYPKNNSMLVTNSIEKDYKHEYTLNISYINLLETDQSIDMNKTIRGKIQIYSLIDTIDLSGTIVNNDDDDFVKINSEPKTSRIIDGKYILVGIKPGVHTLQLCAKDDLNCNTPKVSKKIVIEKGKEASTSNTIIDNEEVPLITFTNESQNANIDIDATIQSITTSTTIRDYNPYDINTLAFQIYRNKALVEQYVDNRVANADCTATNSQSYCLETGKYTGKFDKIKTQLNKEIKNIPKFTSVSNGTNIEDSGLFMTSDDYGTSYYFRGTVINNYVSFANTMWRIIRINGDGTVRLIHASNIGKSVFNDIETDVAYSGYTYGTFETNSNSYDEAFKYVESKDDINKKGQSIIKRKVDEWYEKNILNRYDEYISDTLFCNDKTIYSGLGYGQSSTYFAGSNRVSNKGHTPTLKCANESTTLTEEQLAYSRYTVNGNAINGKKTNGYLKYPIALPTADELAFAGAYYGKYNTTFYFYAAPSWTMTPFAAAVSRLNTYAVFNVYNNQNYSIHNYEVLNNTFVIRPVINIASNVLVNSGDGTKDSPYTLKLV